MKLKKSDHIVIYTISNMKGIYTAVPYFTDNRKGIVIICKNVDIWRIPWYTDKQAMIDAFKIAQCYIERQDGSFYFLCKPSLTGDRI